MNALPGDGCTGCVVDCTPPGVKDPATHHCHLLVVSPEKGWVDAGAHRAMLGMHPATFTSAAELALAGNVGDPGKDMSIGGSDLQTEGELAWVTGEPWGFEDWKPGDPDGSGNCVEIQDVSLHFNDDNCNGTIPFICERP